MTNIRIAITTKQAPAPPAQDTQYQLWRIVWDDENPDWNYRSRTQDPGFVGPDNPPAVMRFYPPDPVTGAPPSKEKPGDFRVNLASPYDWKPLYVAINGGGQEGLQRWEYLVDPKRATYNTTSWPQQAYLTMSNNILRGELVGDWLRLETLKPSDLSKAWSMTRESHPWFVHHFTCVTWDSKTKTTKRIDSTGTPRGQVLWFLVTKEGAAYIPRRHIVPILSN